MVPSVQPVGFALELRALAASVCCDLSRSGFGRTVGFGDDRRGGGGGGGLGEPAVAEEEGFPRLDTGTRRMAGSAGSRQCARGIWSPGSSTGAGAGAGTGVRLFDLTRPSPEWARGSGGSLRKPASLEVVSRDDARAASLAAVVLSENDGGR